MKDCFIRLIGSSVCLLRFGGKMKVGNLAIVKGYQTWVITGVIVDIRVSKVAIMTSQGMRWFSKDDVQVIS